MRPFFIMGIMGVMGVMGVMGIEMKVADAKIVSATTGIANQ